MKRTLSALVVSLFNCYSYAQNTFPSSGNVGIGTLSPNTKLDVRGDVCWNNATGLLSSDANGAIELGPLIGNGSIPFIDWHYGVGSVQDYNVRLMNSGNNQFIIQTASNGIVFAVNGGNIGVGTPNPSQRLDVQGGNMRVYNNGTATELAVGGTLGKTQINLATSGDASGYGIIQSVSVGGTSYGNTVINPSGGNVGIGTTSPQAKLDVKGAAGFNGNLVLYGMPNNGNSNTDSPNLLFQGTDYAGASMLSAPREETYGRRGFAISTHSDASDTRNLVERLRITHTGNVGIGTSVPDAKLTVNGTIHSKEVKVDTSIPVPDYVFEPDYKLPSLEETKAYIAKNKHLPEIPSAKQMEKDGVDLGTMHMMLLKKVEELTLYVIEQNKQLAKQQKINKSLQAQINKVTNKSK